MAEFPGSSNRESVRLSREILEGEQGNQEIITPYPDARFSNRPLEVKRFRLSTTCSVDVAHGLASLPNRHHQGAPLIIEALTEVD
jgi:hypothetical protein